MTTRTLTIGTESTGRVMIPVVDGVKARLVEIKENKYNANRLDFCFMLMDFDYEEGDDEDNALIQQLSNDEYIHYETATLPEAGQKLGKKTKLYKMLKGMSGGKEIDEDTDIDLDEYEKRDYLLDFEHVDAKSGPPDFAVKFDERGRPIQKSQIAKIRPVRKSKAKPVAQVQRALDDEDADLLADD